MGVVYNGVDERVREDAREEIEVFSGLLENEPSAIAELGLSPAQVPVTRTPEDLLQLFNLYFSNHNPEDDTFLMAFIDSEFYRASPEALPPELKPDVTFIQALLMSKQNQEGMQRNTISQRGDILYLVKPIKEGERVLGHLIVAHLIAGERAEVLAAIQQVGFVLLSALGLSILLTAFIAGRVLKPLEHILSTAKKINADNLAERIPIKSQGELADLGIAINSMMDRLEKSFMMQRRFINDAGHELRTPITIMFGHLELMDTSKLPQSERDTVPIVLDELGRMERLVNNLVLLTKADQPDFLQLETFELSKFLSDVFYKIQGFTSEYRHWQCDLQARGVVEADRQRLTQVLMNLAQNAVEHTRKGDRIVLGARITPKTYYVWIEDSGEGIAPEQHIQIFDRFHRVEYRQRKSEGSGLGLSIVKEIVEAHQGNMKLKSELKRGATFFMTFPRQLKRI